MMMMMMMIANVIEREFTLTNGNISKISVWILRRSIRYESIRYIDIETIYRYRYLRNRKSDIEASLVGVVTY